MRRAVLAAMVIVMVIGVAALFAYAVTGGPIPGLAWVALGLFMIVTYLASTHYWQFREPVKT